MRFIFFYERSPRIPRHGIDATVIHLASGERENPEGLAELNISPNRIFIWRASRFASLECTILSRGLSTSAQFHVNFTDLSIQLVPRFIFELVSRSDNQS